MKTNNHSDFENIKRYFGDEMSHLEKHAFEKRALDDPFLSDAMEGYENNPNALKHFEEKLSRKKFRNGKKIFFSSLIVIGALFFSFWMYQNSNKNNENNTVNIQSTTKPINNQNVIEVIPMDIETLTFIQANEQIQEKELIKNFKENKTYQYKQNDIATPDKKIELNQPHIEEKEEKIQITLKKEAKNYPYKYYYDLAVVDYTRYENRNKINKKQYVFTGLTADKEDESQTSEMTEQMIEVSYMEYLEESMYYFSKNKFKNALKRFQIILEQYKNDLNALFYGGLCYYNLGDFSKSIEYFNQILLLNENPFYQEAKWYKAKTLLKLNQKSEAKTLLEEIISDNGFYSKDAIELLKTLR